MMAVTTTAWLKRQVKALEGQKRDAVEARTKELADTGIEDPAVFQRETDLIVRRYDQRIKSIENRILQISRYKGEGVSGE